jgi:hypothetical protein
MKKIQQGDSGVDFKDAELLEWICTESCTPIDVQIQTSISDAGYEIMHGPKINLNRSDFNETIYK